MDNVKYHQIGDESVIYAHRNKWNISILLLLFITILALHTQKPFGKNAKFHDQKPLIFGQTRQDKKKETDFIDLLARSISGLMNKTPGFWPGKGNKTELWEAGFELNNRMEGLDWPQYGSAMAGYRRLMNMGILIQEVLRDGIPGDIVECGVWRGGVSILGRKFLDFVGSDRKSWLFDSFEGLPRAILPQDPTDLYNKMTYLEVSLEEVKEYFELANTSMENVKFVKGYFNESIPFLRSPPKEISILRLDGDMYQSTMDILYYFWKLVPIGGKIINDDGNLEAHSALKDFYRIHGHTFDYQNTTKIDRYGYWFQKDITFQVMKETYYNFQTIQAIKNNN